ncbi:MAG: hypothetical protein K9M07_04745 [Simkaniaceae bacterium]|nr:hypothetical protein [Simkaniaceae bacterium]
MKVYYRFATLFILMVISQIGYAKISSSKGISKPGPEYMPWFTGPFLAPTPVIMAPGHPSLEPAILFSSAYGTYHSNWSLKKAPTIWSINPTIDYDFAISERWGLELYPGFIVNFSEGHSAAFLQDTNIYLGYQIATDDPNSWVPNIQIDLHQLYPTGKYEHLNPNKNGIDATGQGSFQFGPLFSVEKRFQPWGHYLNLEWSIGWLWGIPTHVESFNAFGGGYGTDGKAKPGTSFFGYFSGEYGITQNWVFACDFYLFNQSASSFSGIKGITQEGTTPSVSLPSSTQISITPSLEYNVSENMGFLFGTWVTVAGRNSQAFASLFWAAVFTF